jgi:hypothetical protein
MDAFVSGAASGAGCARETGAEAAYALPACDIDVTPTAAAPAPNSTAFLNNIRLLVSRIVPDSSPVMRRHILR